MELNKDLKLEIGMTVRLNSGGPDMVIYNILNETVYCEWFNDLQEVNNHPFDKACVKLIKDN